MPLRPEARKHPQRLARLPASNRQGEVIDVVSHLVRAAPHSDTEEDEPPSALELEEDKASQGGYETARPAGRCSSVPTACRVLLLSAALVATALFLRIGLPTLRVRSHDRWFVAKDASLSWLDDPPEAVPECHNCPSPPPPWWARSPPPPPPPPLLPMGSQARRQALRRTLAEAEVRGRVPVREERDEPTAHSRHWWE